MKSRRSISPAEWKEIDFSKLVSVERADQAGFKLAPGVRSLLKKALKWYAAQPWVKGAPVAETFVGASVEGAVGVFLIVSARPVGSGKKRLTWVIVGDLPSCGFTVEDNPDGASALEWYCVLMQEWCDAVLDGSRLDRVYPVDAAPTRANAKALSSRLAFLRKKVVPAFN
jgi:hypothetical protein